MPAARELYTVADLRDWPAATAGIEPPPRLAVLGDPVAHSASPPMQNAALAARGIAARYTRIHVRPAELAEALRLAARETFLGVDSTIPHKEAAFSLVNSVDEAAARLGVINTVRFERLADGGVLLRGFNTDGPGFERAVRAEFGATLSGLRVLVLGAGGGAGRAVARQCIAAGCERLILVNRTLEKAHALAASLRIGATAVEVVPWETPALRRALEETDLVVNTSAVGLRPGEPSPLPSGIIPVHLRVFDTVYRADGAPTPLESAAGQAGALAIGGHALLLHQGALSFEHWLAAKRLWIKCGAASAPFPESMFDPTYGYDLAALRGVPAPAGPPDFADFWRRTYQEAMQPPLRLSHRRVSCDTPGLELHEVEFDSLDGVQIGGWLAVPADGRFVRGVVAGHGYGGRQAPELRPPGPPAVTISPCARGFDRSAHARIPGDSDRHVLHGIGSRETYSHRGSAADLWRAASALLELFPDAARCLHYQGASFGGGIGALALPWDSRFHRAFLDVPSFGNHPLRVTLPCFGSGEAVRRYHRRHPEVLTVLAYFDAATGARFLRVPTLVAAALSDPAVPPPGQFAVYNALAGKKELFVRQSGHPNQADDDARLWEQLEAWFAP